MTEPTNAPELIEDAALETMHGALLLPAVQKVREAAARLSVTPETTLQQQIGQQQIGQQQIGATAVQADGSV